MKPDTKTGAGCFVATVTVLWLLLGVSVQAAQLEARIQSVMPSGRVFFQGEDVRLRLVIGLNETVELENPVVHYEVSELESGEVVTSGSEGFNQVVRSAGWVEFTPDVPAGEGIRWYRVDLAFEEGGRMIPIRGAGGEEDRISFGVAGPGFRGIESPEAGDDLADSSRKVMAFYYSWYGNPSVSRAWVHWPEGGHNPDASDKQGLPDVGAAHHPGLGPYDSNDPRVIGQHLTWSEAAGIDVLIATWWGQGSYSDRALGRILDAAAETGVRISLYYETVPGEREQAAVDDLRYILSQYGDHPAFFRHEGRPVIFVYGRALNQLPFAAWQRVIRTVKAERDVVLIADSTDGRWAEIFDGLHMYNPVGQVVGGSDMQRLYESLVWAAKSRGKITSVTVIPGYDDSNIGRPTPIVADRRDGALYDQLWEFAVQSRPDWVIITSFNEWHEGSEIEPSIEYGDRYLRSTAAWSARFKAAPERTLWVERSSMPVVTAPGREYAISADVFRKESEGEVLVRWDVPPGWSVRETATKADSSSHVAVSGKLVVPEDASPGTYAIGMTLALEAYETTLTGEVLVSEPGAAPFDGVGVWVTLGAENEAFGLIQRDQADGVTEPTTVAGVAARKTVKGVTDSKYMYFDVADRFLFDAGGVEVEIGVEYLDEGTGAFRVQYDSSDPFGGPLNGAYTDAPLVRLTDSGEWKTARVRISNARFANRQNGGTDFRLAVGTGELTVRSVYVRTHD